MKNKLKGKGVQNIYFGFNYDKYDVNNIFVNVIKKDAEESNKIVKKLMNEIVDKIIEFNKKNYEYKNRKK